MEAAAIGFDGVEFMEFAVDDQSGRRVSETLRTLGFHYAGRHRSKSVNLFRQGQVNLILNSEQDGAAAEHFHFHGQSVCAMASRVDNALRAVQRAVSLLYPERQEGVGAGERRISAVRAPDGTLLYLVPEEQPAPMLTTVDQIAQAFPWGGWIISFCSTVRCLVSSPNNFGRLPTPWASFKAGAMVS